MMVTISRDFYSKVMKAQYQMMGAFLDYVNYEDEIEEEMCELISQGICPKCNHDLEIRQGKYGEFFACSKFPRCKFTFSYPKDQQ